MVNWFGPEAWGPICADTPRCEPPVDTPCARCRRLIRADDVGLTMPGSQGPVAWHQICHLKSIVAHDEWQQFGLVPDENDGLVAGRFECIVCGMCWSAGEGWSRKAKLRQR